MNVLNANSTILTALLRGLYVAIVAGLVSGLTVLQTTDDNRAAVITGLLAGLGALTVRGGVEGIADANRQHDGEVKPGDVQAIGEGKAI